MHVFGGFMYMYRLYMYRLYMYCSDRPRSDVIGFPLSTLHLKEQLLSIS